MDYKYIEQLIERYFEAETSVGEEDILRVFFSKGDVPAHLQQYAPLFAYEVAEAVSEPLGEDFDRRVMARLRAVGDAPQLRVKAQRLTFTERLLPLWRASAAVAVVVLVIGSAHQAMVQTQQSASIFGGAEAQQTTIPEGQNDPVNSTIRQARDHMKMAVTNDTLQSEKTN